MTKKLLAVAAVASALAFAAGLKPAQKEAKARFEEEVACVFGGKAGDTTAATRANMPWRGGVFTYKLHEDRPNIGDATKEVLEKALND